VLYRGVPAAVTAVHAEAGAETVDLIGEFGLRAQGAFYFRVIDPLIFRPQPRAPRLSDDG